MVRHIFSGLNGMFKCVTPRCLSASTAALTTAGEAAMVPVSPAPFAPKALTGVGVTVRSVSKLGEVFSRRNRVVHHAAG